MVSKSYFFLFVCLFLFLLFFLFVCFFLTSNIELLNICSTFPRFCYSIGWSVNFYRFQFFSIVSFRKYSYFHFQNTIVQLSFHFLNWKNKPVIIYIKYFEMISKKIIIINDRKMHSFHLIPNFNYSFDFLSGIIQQWAYMWLE